MPSFFSYRAAAPLVFAILLGSALTIKTAQAQVSATVTISPTASQIFKGWGCFPSYFRSDWGATNYTITSRPDVQTALYTNLGMTYMRADVQPRLYQSGTAATGITLNTTAVSDIVAQINAAKAKGVTDYILSCWSPPAIWKTPVQTINGSAEYPAGSGNWTYTTLNSANRADFIAYYVKVLQTLSQTANVGKLPLIISMQNEPDRASSYDGSYYYEAWGSETAPKEQWYMLVKDMRTALDNAGLTTVKIAGPEGSGTDQDQNILGYGTFSRLDDPVMRNALGAYAIHGYSQWVWNNLQSGIARYPKDVWITEWSVDSSNQGLFGTTDLDYTIGTARHLASNFIDLKANYWTWWLGWAHTDTDTPYGEILVTGDSGETLKYSSRYYLFQKLWGAVRPNWVVKKLNSTNTAFVTQGDTASSNPVVDLVAFESPTADKSAVVLVNNNATQTANVTVQGLKGTTYTLSSTVASNSAMTTQPGGNVVSGNASITLPAKSVSVLLTQPNTNTHTGTWIARGTFSGAPTYGNIWQTRTCSPNQTYKAEVWLKGTGSVLVKVLNGNWGSPIAEQQFTPTANWAAYSFNFPTGSNTSLTFVIQDQYNSAGTMSFDDAFCGIAGGTNILGNPGFESGLTVWAVGSPFQVIQP